MALSYRVMAAGSLLLSSTAFPLLKTSLHDSANSFPDHAARRHRSRAYRGHRGWLSEEKRPRRPYASRLGGRVTGNGAVAVHRGRPATVRRRIPTKTAGTVRRHSGNHRRDFADIHGVLDAQGSPRSEEHTSELQSLTRI